MSKSSRGGSCVTILGGSQSDRSRLLEVGGREGGVDEEARDIHSQTCMYTVMETKKQTDKQADRQGHQRDRGRKVDIPVSYSRRHFLRNVNMACLEARRFWMPSNVHDTIRDRPSCMSGSRLGEGL